MKRLLLSFSLIVFQFSFSSAQTWKALGVGFKPNKYFSIYLPPINALAVYNGKLIAGGLFDSAGMVPANNIAQWNGASWDSLAQGVLPEPRCIGCMPEAVYCESIYQGNLVVGGAIYVFDTVSYMSGIVQWNGANWDSLGAGINFSYGTVYAQQIYNGSLYVGGNFATAGGKTAYGIAQWNGTNWDTVSTPSAITTIYALAVYNGELYAAGVFDSIGHIHAKNIAKWNGTNWSSVGKGIDSAVYCLTVYNGNLYAGGAFDSAGGVLANNIAQWNGSTWRSFGGGMNNTVVTLYVDDSILVAGGSFTMAGSINAHCIAFWNGTSWDSLGAGMNGPVFALCNYAGGLCAGGLFSKAGNISANNIAEWTGPLGINNIKSNNLDITAYPNPNNGQFTIQSSGINGQESVDIYNVLGARIYSGMLKQVQHDYEINLSAQPAGVYLYRVLAEDGSLLGEGKLIIQK